MSPEARTQLGHAGREHILKSYSFENYQNEWENILFNAHERYGSWETRKNYKCWRSEEV